MQTLSIYGQAGIMNHNHTHAIGYSVVCHEYEHLFPIDGLRLLEFRRGACLQDGRRGRDGIIKDLGCMLRKVSFLLTGELRRRADRSNIHSMQYLIPVYPNS
jgi:hypothetical protein